MPIRRRSLLALVAASPALSRLAQAADTADAAGPLPPLGVLEGPRTFGSPNAKTKVTEFFSLTCTHCAAFQRETFPQVRAKLIESGKVQMVYSDFPLDRVALMAAQVARALPPERYEPFITALFASQDRWAFARGVNNRDELQKMALLAGMSPATFNAAVDDEQLRTFIIGEEEQATKQYNVDSTPTFLVNGKTHSGEMDYAAFEQFVTQTAG